MNENIKQLNTVQQIRDEFRITALTALIATAAIWVFVSMNLFWTAVVYFGFLLIISLIYGTIDYDRHDAEIDSDS
jgi:ABC-type bacteriocin/lantibiotic exporter with double-glycine peptidase domain